MVQLWTTDEMVVREKNDRREMVIRGKVDRSLRPEVVVSGPGVQNVIQSVLDTMLHGEGEDVEIVFFPINWMGGFTSTIDLEKECESQGLRFADPYSLASMNREALWFARKFRNLTQWKDSSGKWCFLSIQYRTDGVRCITVDRGGDWYGRWWVATCRIQSR